MESKVFSEDTTVDTTDLFEKVTQVFARDGAMSEYMSSYIPRRGQVELAQQIAKMEKGDILIAEAGTGTGKTFAYLIPPLLENKKPIVVSTGSKALQDQLLHKDFPSVSEILCQPYLRYMALKGRMNYLCRCQLERSSLTQNNNAFLGKMKSYVEECIEGFSDESKIPCFGEIKFKLTPEQADMVLADNITCSNLIHTCDYARESQKLKYSSDKSVVPDYEYSNHCFFMAARHRAQHCNMVAINHALFFSSYSIEADEVKNNGIVPEPEVMIFDEAHNLPDVARNLFTREFSQNYFLNFADTLYKDWKRGSSSGMDTAFKLLKQYVNKEVDALDKCLKKLALCFEKLKAGHYNINEFKYLHTLGLPKQECAVYQKPGLPLGDLFFYQDCGASAALYSQGQEEKKGQSSLLYGDPLREGISAQLLEGVAFHLTTKAPLITAPRLSGSTTANYGRNFEEDAYLKVKGSRENLFPDPFFRKIMGDIIKAIITLKEKICKFEKNGGDSKNLVATHETKSNEHKDKVNKILGTDQVLNGKSAKEEIENYLKPIDELYTFIVDLMTTDRDKQGERKSEYVGYIYIYKPKVQEEESEGEKSDLVFKIVLAPIEVSRYIRPVLMHLHTQGVKIVMTSATLTANSSFKKFCHDIGLQQNEVKTLMVESPFDYQKNACLWYGASFPEIKERNRITQCIDMVTQAIRKAPGGVFFLTTSYSALWEAKVELKKRFKNRQVLAQGEDSIANLMKAFKEDGKAILVGTSSFWEGVDVPGNALSLVIIDKLPFKGTGDPLVLARNELCMRQGGIPFVSLSLPEAIIMLRQGVGRLIRKETDTGALILMDPRLESKGYGHQFIASLPPLHRVTDEQGVLDFFKNLKKER